MLGSPHLRASPGGCCRFASAQRVTRAATSRSSSALPPAYSPCLWCQTHTVEPLLEHCRNISTLSTEYTFENKQYFGMWMCSISYMTRKAGLVKFEYCIDAVKICFLYWPADVIVLGADPLVLEVAVEARQNILEAAVCQGGQAGVVRVHVTVVHIWVCHGHPWTDGSS